MPTPAELMNWFLFAITTYGFHMMGVWLLGLGIYLSLPKISSIIDSIAGTKLHRAVLNHYTSTATNILGRGIMLISPSRSILVGSKRNKHGHEEFNYNGRLLRVLDPKGVMGRFGNADLAIGDVSKGVLGDIRMMAAGQTVIDDDRENNKEVVRERETTINNEPTKENIYYQNNIFGISKDGPPVDPRGISYLFPRKVSPYTMTQVKTIVERMWSGWDKSQYKDMIIYLTAMGAGYFMIVGGHYLISESGGATVPVPSTGLTLIPVVLL